MTAMLMTLFGMSALGVVSVVAITILRPHDDNTQLVATLLGFLVPTTAIVIDTLKTSEVHESVKTLQSQVASKPATVLIDTMKVEAKDPGGDTT
jgi:hypothetical protein